MRLERVWLATLSLLLLAPVSRTQTLVSNGSAGTLPAQHREFRLSQDWLATARAHSCPASLDVRHGAGLGQVVATNGVLRPAAQALDITVTNHGSSEIASLDVVVQLRSGKSRMMPLVSDDDAFGRASAFAFGDVCRGGEERGCIVESQEHAPGGLC